jgi:hypothetical protein
MEQTEYFGLYVTSTPPAPTLTGTELVPVIVGGITNQTTTQDIANLAALPTNAVLTIGSLNAQLATTTGAGTDSTTTITTPAPNHHQCSIFAALSVVITDATAVITVQLQFSDQSGVQAITFPTFTIATAQSQTFAANFQGNGSGATTMIVSWTGAVGGALVNTSIRLVDTGP